MTTSQKLVRCLLNPRDTLFRLAKLLDADPFTLKIPDVRDLALTLPDRSAAPYMDEIRFLEQSFSHAADGTPARQLWSTFPFPYPRVRPESQITAGFDDSRSLPFAVHKGRRLYFPKGCSVEDAARQFRGLVEVEGITGEGCLEKSPHCYQADDFKVEPSDIVLDMGCAEGLFALDAMDKAKAVYAFEGDKKWFAPLGATFAGHGEKVRIVRKFVGVPSSDGAVRLEDVVQCAPEDAFFIKMDVEGAELDVIDSMKGFLASRKIKLACCLYHRQDDEGHICKRLKEYGFECAFSDGFMLPAVNDLRFPYFRRGIVRARNY